MVKIYSSQTTTIFYFINYTCSDTFRFIESTGSRIELDHLIF